MATPDPTVLLRPLPRAQIGTLGALLPAGVSLVEPLRVLSLRCLPGSEAALAATTGTLPGPGRFTGTDPLLVWRSPSEWLHVGTRDEPADALLRALPPGGATQAIDLSDGIAVFELQGPRLDALLPRLLDAGVQLGVPGQGTRARLADIAVVALRLAPERLWLLIDRANAHYLAHWLAYASAALQQ